MTDFYSQAFNFAGGLQGGVDPRTGLYGLNMPVARLVGNANLGPSIDLTLRYAPLGNPCPGVGVGVTLGVSQYDTKNRLLTLSSGDQYKVVETATNVILQQNKLPTVLFQKITSGKYSGYYKVTHKSGEVELLRNDAFAVKVPSQIFSPTGRRLDLTWDSTGTTRRLTRVSDETDVLFSASYGTASSTLAIWPGQAESYTLRLSFQNGYLTKVENTSQSPSLAWVLSYSNVGGRQLLTGLQSPTGLVEQVTYRAGSMPFPSGAGLTALPCVISYTQYPQGNQPAITRSYDYSTNNYLGASASGGSWNSDNDYLYNVLTRYEYWSREISVCGDRTMTIKRTYNNFHLQTEEVISVGTCSRIAETDYYAQVGKPFDQQPAQFQLARSTTVTYTKNTGQTSRSEHTATEYDTSGNLTRHVAPDGTETVWVYYPASGESGTCPPDPNQFVRFPKTRTVTPPRTGFAAPVEVTGYAYGALGAVPNTPISAAVMKTREDLSRDGILLHRSAYRYVTTTTASDLGRMTGMTETVFVSGNTPPSYDAQTTFSLTRQGSQVVQSATTTTHDGLSYTHRRSQTCFAARLMTETDPWGVETRYTYDALGRITSRTVNPGTAFETTQSYAYDLLAGSQNTSSTTVTDPRGNQVRYWVDGLGREIRRQRLDADGTLAGWLTIGERGYDAWGRLIRMTECDVLRPATGTTGTSLVAPTTYSYDDWGHNDLVSFADGHQERTAYDPVALQADNGVVGTSEGRQLIEFDPSGRPVTVTHVDQDNIIRGRIEYLYDGLGRLRRLTDELGNTTAYDYDAWDRVVTTTLPDWTAIGRSYAPDSIGPSATAISVGGHPLATQTFDGLGRRLSTSVGGGTHRFTYTGSQPVPSTEHRPDGVEVSAAYEPLLGFARTRLAAGGVIQTFRYDPAGVLLTDATQSGAAVRTITYRPSGLIAGETFKATPDDGTGRATTFIHSLQGRLQTWTDVTGTVQNFSYDSLGRATGMTDPAMTMAMSYDRQGRVSDWTVTDRSSGATLTTTLGYDAFGREIRRDLTGSATLSITQTWQNNGQLAHRTTMQGTTTLRDESYGYDSRNRLVSYACTGTARPVDISGQPIRTMALEYDDIGNVTSCITTLDGGTDTAGFIYDTTDPARLLAITHSHPGYPQRIDLSYDAAGRTVRDTAGRSLGYDALGRLISVSGGGGGDCTYDYDATGRMIAQTLGSDRQALYYRAGRIVNRLAADGSLRVMCMAGLPLGQRRDGGQPVTALFGTDPQGSIIVATGLGSYAYGPHGYRPTSTTVPPGFNGEWQDPVTGASHLGNGYRAYDPVMMRFTTPDSWSPFGAGGLNRYAYCLGDPVNRIDPSGHLSVGAWIGIGLGILGIVATVATFGLAAAPVIAAEGVAAGLAAGASAVGVIGGLGVAADITGIVSGAIEEAAPEASSILGWVSMGLGAPGAMEGLGKLGTAVGRRVGNSLDDLSQRVATIQREGLGGRGGPKAGRAMARNARTPWQAASEGRTELPARGPVTDLQSRAEVGDTAPNADGTMVHTSNYPHLTQTGTPHVTSARYITTVTVPTDAAEGTSQEFHILQRFRQDNTPASRPEHDRYIAADNDGNTYNVSAAPGPNARGNVRAPRRGVPIGEPKHEQLAFTIGGPADKYRLSPLSIRRQLPDTGYH